MKTDLKPGDIVDVYSKQFVSTSTDAEAALKKFGKNRTYYNAMTKEATDLSSHTPVLYNIKLPKGQPVIDLTTNREELGEKEILLPEGTFFKVVSKSDKKDHIQYDVEVVSEPTEKSNKPTVVEVEIGDFKKFMAENKADEWADNLNAHANNLANMTGMKAQLLKIEGETIGYALYTVSKRKKTIVSMKLMAVNPKWRGKSLSSKLLEELATKYPNSEIHSEPRNKATEVINKRFGAVRTGDIDIIQTSNIHQEKEQLEVKTSTIPNAGRGLFAKQTFKYGDHIVDYTGEVLTKEQLDARYGEGLAPYALELKKGLYVDAANESLSSLGRFANDVRGTKKKTNARFSYSSKKQTARLVATRIIHPGDEIFVSYGAGYWSKA